MVEQEKRYVPVAGVQVHETDDGLVLFDPDTDRVHHLNFTAGVIYTLCEGGSARSELLARMVELYDLPEEPSEDVDQALEKLVNEGLLTTDSV